MFSNSLLSAFTQRLRGWRSFTGFLLIVVTLSCQKDDKEMTAMLPPELTNEDGILKFSSADSYEKLLRSPKILDDLMRVKKFESLERSRSAKYVGYTSIDSLKSKKEIPQTLARLLNKDGVYQIGHWIIKLDFDKENVFVMDQASKTTYYNDLVAGHVSDKVWQFTFADEVLDLLSNGYKSSPSMSSGARPAIFCGGGISDDPDSQINSSFYSCSPTSGRSSFYNIVEYSKYGTYFECDLKWGGITNLGDILNNQLTPLGGCENIGTIDKKYFYETNCNNSWTGSAESYGTPYSLQVNTYGDDFSASSRYDGRERIYQGSRGLRCLKVELFRTTNGAGISLTNRLIRGC